MPRVCKPKRRVRFVEDICESVSQQCLKSPDITSQTCTPPFAGLSLEDAWKEEEEELPSATPAPQDSWWQAVGKLVSLAMWCEG